MVIPFAPQLSIKTLYKIIHTNNPTGISWCRPFEGRSLYFYTRGMWAIAEGISGILKYKGKKKGIIWLPDYFCNEATIPLRSMNVSIFFYQIKEDLTPDWDMINTEIRRSQPPDVFIIVHYFGFPNSLDKVKEFTGNCGASLLEDATHLIMPMKGIGENIAVFSPRKLLPIPEGGLLILPDEISVDLIKMKYCNDHKSVIIWFLSRFLQYVMVSIGFPWHKFTKIIRNNKNRSEDNLKNKNTGLYPSNISLKMISASEKELPIIVKKRREHYLQLQKAINDIKGVKPLFPYLPEEVCPYAFPIFLTKNKDKICNKIKDYGIQVSTWPDLPPEVISEKGQHRNANWLYEHILLIPVHQDLGEKQMEYMFSSIKNILMSELE